MDISNLRGCGTALVTPFKPDYSLDEEATRNLVEWQIKEGINFLVLMGTTGENPTLKTKEHLRMIEIALEVANGRIPILGGAGGNATDQVTELAKKVTALGVDGILSVSPFYNKPSQEGIYQHFRALAKATTLPILVYNVPGRTGSNVEPRTLIRLSEISNILGVKEASGSIGQVDEILRFTRPERFRVFSGDDALTLPLMALGAHGVISVVSNVAPRQMTGLVSCCEGKDFHSARREHRRLATLMHAMFIESNPIPVKAALGLMGKIHPVYRLPMVPLQLENRAKLETALRDFGLLPK